ncbi:multiple sugar transport system ATP-binding protein [Pseudovibrio ascidiaceicola]|uniref:Multiple sugar transport system ATP-binding protein n=1 Tax=Pseudovibrio ascidiaceicola TaxID=285279 RepID=A0A1I3ZE78_9HYPH|nr:sn-glycerol-3-phosphate ABC transporter ATP-binding protein UgpC [Pseudovibrio ascidiaceicola]SFK42347.1 multiple sugar transport system ATP-binding protein [Pseudovibrio ascidiaceicola]
MASIQITEATKSYGNTAVLHGIDLNIQDGEFIVLVGPSGCGKSTLLRMIAGLEEVTSGSISINERIINDLPPRDRDIAMVFQSYALYPHMSVEENISYAMTLRKSPKEKIASAVNGVSNILGLNGLLERRPKALSGGQRQRVAMGRAIVRDPQAFLFDEPLSNLDARLREQMRSEIRKLHRKLNATSIYVTHDQIEAMTMADRIVAMHDGYIQQVGTPLEIYDKPANVFVASFIGSPAMNFIRGTASASGEGYHLQTDQGHQIILPKSLDLKDRMDVILGVRPEHLMIVEEGPASLPATVDLIEPMGLSTLVHVRVGQDSLKIFTLDRPDIAEGTQVHVSYIKEKLHMFDARTEMRLESPV